MINNLQFNNYKTTTKLMKNDAKIVRKILTENNNLKHKIIDLECHLKKHKILLEYWKGKCNERET